MVLLRWKRFALHSGPPMLYAAESLTPPAIQAKVAAPFQHYTTHIARAVEARAAETVAPVSAEPDFIEVGGRLSSKLLQPLQKRGWCCYPG